MLKFQKKFALSSLAAGVLALIGGSASAAITTVINLDTPSGAAKYAKELNYTAALPLAGAANALNFKAAIGFGLSNGQTRYIRLDYGNAVLATGSTHAAVVGTDIADDTTTASLAAAAVSAGGAATNSYVIYQITAGGDIPNSDKFAFKIPPLAVTSTASPVTVTMSLHETAVSAVAGLTGTGLLYQKTGNLATFATGLSFTLTPATQTAAVTTTYKEFCLSATNCTAASAVLTQPLGEITTYDATTNGTKGRNGVALTLTDIVTTANAVFTGVFGATATAGLFLDNSDSCGTVYSAATTNVGLTTATFAVDTAAIAAKNLCYTVSGNTAIPAQTVTGALTVVTKPAATTTADVAAATSATILHDGSVLQSAFFTNVAGYSSRFVLTNTSSTAAPFTSVMITEAGNTCTAPVSPYAGTIPANGQLVVLASDVCSAFSGPKPRGAVEFTVSAPATSVTGVSYVQSPDMSISTNALQRPGM